ncbi:MAG: ABC transporter permease [Chitinophagaceae bacterium]
MIKNYFRIAMRNLVRNKSYSIINIAGLAIGIASCLLLFVVVKYELSYDRFQTNYDRIYRIVTKDVRNDGSEDNNPGIACPAYEALKTTFPQFEKVVPVISSSQNQVTLLGTDQHSDLANAKKFLEPAQMIFTYPAYFEVFNSTWLAGNASALAKPGNIIIDKELALKYFGDWKNAMGQFIKINNQILVQVAGIVEKSPDNSDFPIALFISYEEAKKYPGTYNYSTEWGNLSSSHQIYVLLPQTVKPATLQSQMPAFVAKNYKRNGNRKPILEMQALKEMHFDYKYGTLGDHSTSKTILWTLSLIGVLIILMASINFVNLSTAQAVGRSKEVGIRKVLGSLRAQLIAQVLGETFLLVLFSVLLSIGIAKLALPYLVHVASVPATISLFSTSTFLFIVTVLILVTALSGIYPALIVSGFKPILALKSKINAASIGGISLRRILVVTQFGISQILIVGTIVAVSQMNYVRNIDLGFNKEAVLILPAFSDSANLAKMKPLKQALLQNPDVVSVSFASDEASSDNNWASNFAFDNKEDKDFPVFHKYGDEDYSKTFGLQYMAGRAYGESDTIREIVINETLVKKLGLASAENAIGKNLRIGGGQWFPIVGVVKDFKTNSLREDIKPLTIAPRAAFYYQLAIKLNTKNLSKTTALIQSLWEKTYPEYAYTSHFVDETIERFYGQEKQLSLLYKIFACIAIFISCLGLYGLVSYMATQKTKEVGIRKVLGASIGNIVFMFSKEFTVLIGIAFVLAAPLSWYIMSKWLQNFQFRIDIGIGVFALAIVVSLVIAWITVGYKAIRAAIVNPVKSLRTE